MRIADGVEALELTVNLMGRETTIYPTLFWDEESVILVDAGFPGLEQQIREAIEMAGVSFDRLNKVIITHQDVDHVGSLPEILAKSQRKVEVLAHEVEKPYIQGDKPLIKADAAKRSKLFETLPEEQRKRLQAVFSNPPKAKIDRTIEDGEELPYCGGIIVIYTPGHTPGHICLYHKPSKTLVTGDALTANEGRLSGPNPSATYDMDEANKSVKKLAQYDIENVICYHGGVFKEDVQKRILQLTI
ncbi:MBL fold metallo-hydrolase [Desulfosporosinus sp. SB140]|uniref:MBL fold metallo-hydrolase n=1 Tax=Desulfosporosinus paludis TaxID=3115649 RepID=UPI003890D0F7